MRRMGAVIVAVVLGWAACLSVAAGEELKAVAATEPGWTQWRGPRRDGICDGKGLMQSWPEGGPQRLWEVGGLGTGWSGPIIARGTIYTTGDVGDEVRIVAMDLAGKVKWRVKNGSAWKGPNPGARASVRHEDGAIYHMNAHGRVVCLNAQTGAERWAVNVLERFDGKNITWGLAENLVVDGGKVVATPGGKKGMMVALDKTTGATVWSSGPLMYENGADGASYVSPMVVELGGGRQIVGCGTHNVFGVDAQSGRLLWQRPMVTRYDVIGLTPALVGDGVFMTAPDSGGGVLRRLTRDGAEVRVEDLWTTTMDTCHGGVIHRDGVLFGSWYRTNSGFGAIDAKTGKELYRTRELEMGSMIWADGRLYYLSQQGVMALIKADAKGFEMVGKFKLVEGRVNDAWAHPAIVDGRLYLRYHDKLWCYDVKAR